MQKKYHTKGSHYGKKLVWIFSDEEEVVFKLNYVFHYIFFVGIFMDGRDDPNAKLFY